MDIYEEMRDDYLTGKIWNVGEIVEAKGMSGEIVRKGTNYISYMTEDNKVHKAWLHEIELEEASSLSTTSCNCNLQERNVGEIIQRKKKLNLMKCHGS